MKEDHYLERIEAYRKGQLSDSEKIKFEQELEDNSSLLEAKKKYEAAMEAVDLLSDQAMSTNIQKWIAEENTFKTKTLEPNRPKETKVIPLKRGTRIKRLAIAASVILLATLFWFTYIAAPNSSNTQLAHSYFQTLDKPNFRSTQEADIEKVLDLYDRKNYAAAIDILNKEEATSDRKIYLLAYCYFKNKEYPAAEQAFKKLKNWNDTAYKEEAEWGILMVLLAQDKLAGEFETLLDRICKSQNHSFHNKAKELKAKLKMDI